MFGISGPKKYNFVCFLFHFLNILSEFINNFLISTQKDIVGSVRLVRCDEVAVESGWERHDSLELILKLLDQVRLEDLCALAGFVEILFGDVPTVDHKFAWFCHGEQLLNRLVNV